MAVTAEFESNWLEMQEKYGAGIDSGEVPVLSPGDIDASVSLPAVKFTAPYVEGGTNIFQDFRHVPMKTFVLAVQAQADAIKAAWEQWFGTGDTSGIQKIWKDWYTQTQDDWTTWFGTEPSATSEGSGVKKEWTTLKTNVQRATNDANTAAATANQAAGRVETAISGANAAASAANSAAERTDTSRQQIEANEQSRQQNEQGRVSAESGRVSQESTRQQNESTRQQNEQTRQSQETAREQQATSDHNRAESDHSTATDDHSTAVVDHTNVQGAENVNAELEGMTVTITNRQGTKTSVNIGFEIYRTYGSIAAMNADAANVPQGKFVMIATTDPTSTENAQLWARNDSAASGANPFTFLSDLDQASTAAWADWLESMKPAINERITTADNDHTRADSDHTRAETDHTAFVTQEAQRQQTFETNETSRQTTFTTNETARQTEWTTLSREVTQATGNANTAAGNADAAADLATDAATEAEVKAQDAYQATIEARKVNADLNGTVLTVWNRYGGTKSTNLQGPKGDKGEGIDYSTMSEAEKEELTLAVIERIDRDGGNAWYPVDINQLKPGVLFKKSSVIAIDGIFYRATKDTENPPVTLVQENGHYVVDVVNGQMAFWVADYTVLDGWMVFTDAGIAYWRQNFEARLQALEDRIAALENN